MKLELPREWYEKHIEEDGEEIGVGGHLMTKLEEIASTKAQENVKESIPWAKTYVLEQLEDIKYYLKENKDVIPERRVAANSLVNTIIESLQEDSEESNR